MKGKNLFKLIPQTNRPHLSCVFFSIIQTEEKMNDTGKIKIRWLYEHDCVLHQQLIPWFDLPRNRKYIVSLVRNF